MLFLFIIFGFKGVTYKQGEGEFHCPHCGTKRPYKHKRVRRFFSIYFIPLIPMNLMGEFAECGVCARTYDLKVLDYDPHKATREIQSEFQKAIRRTMILMMVADGEIDEGEIKSIKRIYGTLSEDGTELNEDEIRAEAESAQKDRPDLMDYMRNIAPFLNEAGKDKVIRCAYMVAMADGEFAKEEKLLIDEIAEYLEISPIHLKGLYMEMKAMYGAGVE